MLSIGVFLAAAASLASGRPAGGDLAPLAAILLAEQLMIPTLLGEGPIFLLNGPQWSLFLEMAANACHALVVKQLGTGLLVATIAISAALLVWIGLQHHGLNVGWRTENLAEGAPRTLFSFCVGLGVHRLRAAGRLPQGVLPWWAIAALLAAAIGLPNPHAPLAHGLRDIAIVLALFPILLVNAVSASMPPRLVPLAAWAGFISYPLYLLHASVLALAAPTLAAPTASPIEKLSGYAGVVAGCLLLSWAVGKWADEPIRKRLTAALKSKPRAHARAE
jgi:peptidoglycan/LPS O-acetylase OafA/YrhL